MDDSWRYFFDGMELGHSEQPSTTLSKTNAPSGNETATVYSLDLSTEAKVANLINAYRERGRLLANTNPLKDPPTSHPLLSLSHYGLSEADLDKTFTAGKLIGIGPAKLRSILERLKKIYCSSIAVEFTHIQDPAERNWLQDQMEKSGNEEILSKDTRKFILQRLTDSEAFERFLHTRYVAQKRFSVEGGESLIPCLDRIIQVAADLGTNNLVFGMAHRGRLNVLVNIFGKGPEFVFTEFEDNYEFDHASGMGDVKYHKGFSADVTTVTGKKVHLSLAHNPSHLEFVNPVVEGVARAKQEALRDTERKQVIPVLIHGDAAFAGQGVVYETLNLSQLPGYSTGGTIHIVIDNQVGFTTSPEETRSTTYSTDVCKMLEIPIFHVNGDHPEAIWYATRLATEYRQKFKKDTVIDIICYRKYGHNEGDEPAFTQPNLYKKIKTHPSTRESYAKRLVAESVLSQEESDGLIEKVNERLTAAQGITRSQKPKPFSSAYGDVWKGFRAAKNEDLFKEIKTGVPITKLRELAAKIFSIPSDFKMHPKLTKFYAARAKAVEEGQGLDWGNAEALAYASLLFNGYSVRLSGQDCQRGTFTHRHAVLHDFETGKLFTPLTSLNSDKAQFRVWNSHLSETAVMGFEYGWSLADPMALVIWEAQFGDFANGAQVIIDQFLSSSESKWQRVSGMVLYLPHGYEGQGPEHSSARLERFLQLCGENNMAICNFTTPAQLFHALRRQMLREFRKPLVVMTPKSLLRHPAAISSLSELESATFQEVIDDPQWEKGNKKDVKRVLLCSGKIYYDLIKERAKDLPIAVLRVEQLYPWPKEKLAQILSSYSTQDIAWVQEEPRNMGAWTHVYNHWFGGLDEMKSLLPGYELRYIGRNAAAVPAVGSHSESEKQQDLLVRKALSL